jgi:hypothetical protein
MRRPVAAPLLIAAALVTAIQTTPAFGWSTLGHEVVARIAELRMKKSTLKLVQAIADSDPLDANPFDPFARKRQRVGDQRANDLSDFVVNSVWLDEVRNEMPKTSRWHFIDLPLDAVKEGFNLAERCKSDTCAPNRIDIFTRVLAEAKIPRKFPAGTPPQFAPEVAEALKMLTHLVGDIHQPLHAAEHGKDQGGNKREVVFFGRSKDQFGAISLHAVWDAEMLEHIMLAKGQKKTVDDLAKELVAALDPAKVAEWSSASVVDWGWEAHDLARDFGYRTDDGKPIVDELRTGIVLGDAYFARAMPKMLEQLQKAGVRLAALLDQVLD